MGTQQRLVARGLGWTLVLSVMVSGSWGHGESLSAVQQLWVNSFDAERGGDYDKALVHTERIVADAGDFYLPNLRMGWLYYLKKEYGAAIIHYRKAAQLSPGALSALQGVMNCARALGDVEQEMQMAKAILLLAPMNYDANLRLAVLNYESQAYGVAGSYYRKLLALYPEDLQIANGLAWCCFREGLAKEAAALFRNVLVVHPNYLDAKIGLACCLGTGELGLASINRQKAR